MGGAYFNVNSAITGTNNVNINTSVPNAGTPYMGGVNTFVGNMNIYCGTLMISGSDSVFGNTSNGTRLITFYNNAIFRNNGSLSTLGANRRFEAGAGGGNYNTHAKNVTLGYAGQLAGSETFTILTDSGVNSGNVFAINATNEAFTGTLLLTGNVTLKLGTGGNVSNSPIINLSATTSLLDVTPKASGYTIPAGQVLAGIGMVTGNVNVAQAAAKLHPGSYSLPGPTSTPGILTVFGDLAITNGGVYAWDLAQLKDNATASPGTTTFSSIAAAGGSVNLTGGTLALSFVSGIATPASTNLFWKNDHVWTILTAPSAPVGTLAVSNGSYGSRAFTTRVNGNSLELVYATLHLGTVLLLR